MTKYRMAPSISNTVVLTVTTDKERELLLSLLRLLGPFLVGTVALASQKLSS